MLLRKAAGGGSWPPGAPAHAELLRQPYFRRALELGALGTTQALALDLRGHVLQTTANHE